MKYEVLEEMDYENLDDLPLFDHIEWNHLEDSNPAPVSLEPLFYC